MATRKGSKAAPKQPEVEPAYEIPKEWSKPESPLEQMAYEARVITRTARDDPLAALSLIESYSGDKAPLYTAVAVYATSTAEFIAEKGPDTAALWNRVAQYALSKSVLAPNGPGRRKTRF
jgi:hypothetical protein